jgi:hypothetical protein
VDHYRLIAINDNRAGVSFPDNWILSLCGGSPWLGCQKIVHLIIRATLLHSVDDQKKNAKIDSIIELELDKDVRVAATSNRSMNSGSESGNMSSDCSTGGCTPRMTYGQQSLQPAKKKKVMRAQNKEQVEGVIVLTLKTAYASRA